MFGTNEHIKIDIAHSQLIGTLVKSLKPLNILEFGIGGGRATDEIILAIDYNQNNPKYTLVDNWMDFGYQIPQEVINKYSKKFNIVSSDEKSFVFSCKEKYDFILSDADHHNTEKWFEYVYDNLLEKNGTLIYHDINVYPSIEESFPNLLEILNKAKSMKLKYKLFNRSSLPHERCHRGLLVIFK